MMHSCTLKTYATHRLKMSRNARNVIPKLGDIECLARIHMGGAHAGHGREAGLNLEFGMMNLEIQHDAFTRHDMGSRKGAKALSNPPGAEPR